MLPIVRVYGQFTAASTPATINLDLGFVPDYFVMVAEDSTSGTIGKVEWFKTAGDNKAMKEIAAGTKTWVSTNSISAYSPAVTVSPSKWTASTAYVAGQIVHPVKLPAGFQSMPLFKCTTAGTTGATEPTWITTAYGATTSDTAVFTYIDPGTGALAVSGPKGVTVNAAMQTASVVYDYVAEGRIAS